MLAFFSALSPFSAFVSVGVVTMVIFRARFGRLLIALAHRLGIGTTAPQDQRASGHANDEQQDYDKNLGAAGLAGR